MGASLPRRTRRQARSRSETADWRQRRYAEPDKGGASFNPPPHPRPAWPRLRRERRRQWTHHFLRRHAVVRYMPGTFKDPTPRPRGMPRIGGGTRQTHRRARDGSKQFYSVRKQALRIAYPASRTRGYAHCHRGDSNHSTAYLASRYGRGDSATGASTRDRRRTRAGGRGRGGTGRGRGWCRRPCAAAGPPPPARQTMSTPWVRIARRPACPWLSCSTDSPLRTARCPGHPA